MKKYNRLTKLILMTLALLLGIHCEETFVYATNFVEEVDEFFYITDDDRVIRKEGIFNPQQLEDGHYQIYRGTGWIRDESDLITSAILEGEGEGNSIKLSKTKSANVTHGFNVDGSISLSMQRKASIGAGGGFGWNPPQVSTNFTASAIKEASGDQTLYAKLYVMSERIDTYHIERGKIVDTLASYNPIGTIGLYGEEESAAHINIMAYHVHQPVRIVLGEMETQSQMMSADEGVAAEDGTGVVVKPGGSIDLEDLFKNETPLFLASDVLTTSPGADTLGGHFILVETEEPIAMGEGIDDDGDLYKGLKDGVYTRFLGAGWVIGGEGYIGTSTVMPGSVGTLAQKVQDSFKVTHSIGIETSVELEKANNRAKIAVKAAYSHVAESEEATTMEVKVKTSPQHIKHIDAYENNLKYDVITIENGEIVEESQVYVTNGIYARVVEAVPLTPIAAGEEKQVFNSLVDQDYLPSIANDYDLYIAGKIGPEYFKTFHAHKLAYGADDTVNINIKVEETALYKFRVARAYGNYFTKPFQEPAFYSLPESVRVFNVNPYSGNPNYEEAYIVARGTETQEGGPFYQVYLEAGQSYVIAVGASTLEKAYYPENYTGYLLKPEDMNGSILEIEKTYDAYLNAAEQLKLNNLLKVYNTYQIEDYLKESFLDFERIRIYANNLWDRDRKALPEAIEQVIIDLEAAASKLIPIDYKPVLPEPEPEPELEFDPSGYYVKVDVESGEAEKVPAQDPSDLVDGIYMIDRGYGWIKSETEDLVGVVVLDAKTEEGMIGITRAVNTSTTHTHKEDVFVGLQLAKIFQIGLNFGFGQSSVESRTITANHTLIVPEGNKGYLKVYTLNHKYDTFEVENGKIISYGVSYDPIGTIGMTALTTDTAIDENDFIVANDTYVFKEEAIAMLSSDPYDITEVAFDDVIEEVSEDAILPGGLRVGDVYKLDKTIEQIKAGNIPNAIPVNLSEITEDGVYVQYLGDGYIDGEDSFISTITADAHTRSSIQSTTQTKSFTEGGTKEVIGVESGVFEMVVAMTYKFKQEMGETISLIATTFDTYNQSQLKVYDMYKRYELFEVKNSVVARNEYLSINSGLYGKTFVPGDYTAALSEETERNTLSTKVQAFDSTAKNAYTGGADSITRVNEQNDGTLIPLERMGYSLDTDISKLPDGIYVIDLGDNWVQEEVINLIGSNTAYNYTTSLDSTMRTAIEQVIEAETQFAIEGTSTMSHKYKNPITQNKVKKSLTLIAAVGESIKEGSKASSTLFMNPQQNGLLKLYVANRRTDLVEVKNGEIIDRVATYTPNGVRSIAQITPAGVALDAPSLYISEPTKDTFSTGGTRWIEDYTKDAKTTPYLERSADLFITEEEARTDAYLAQEMYNEQTGELEDGIYTFYLGDWYVGDVLGKHYITAGSGAELSQEIIEQTTFTYKGSVYVTGLMDAVSASIASSFNTTFKYTNTVGVSLSGYTQSTDDLLEVKSKRQLFLTVTVKDNKLETQTLTDKLIGIKGSIEDTI